MEEILACVMPRPHPCDYLPPPPAGQYRLALTDSRGLYQPLIKDFPPDAQGRRTDPVIYGEVCPVLPLYQIGQADANQSKMLHLTGPVTSTNAWDLSL